jgi:phosphonoacetate hydrolase
VPLQLEPQDDLLQHVDRRGQQRRYAAPEHRTIAVCLDGTAHDYLELARDEMPNLLGALRAGGRLLSARAQLPTLTNVNNASIVTGVSAAVHGISGNHYLDPDGQESQLTDPTALRADTVLAAAQRAGIPLLGVSAKEKLRGLLGADDVPSISAERADEQTLEGLDGLTGEGLVGRPRPGIYDPQLSAYALDLTLALAERLGTRLAYCSLTDFGQHKVAPGDLSAAGCGDAHVVLPITEPRPAPVRARRPATRARSPGSAHWHSWRWASRARG